jgi:ferrous iron transport protein A
MVSTSANGKPLLKLRPGDAGLVERYTDDYIGGKLMSMGVLPGSRIEVVRIAPFGGGYYVKVDHSYIALRKKEAGSIVLR